MALKASCLRCLRLFRFASNSFTSTTLSLWHSSLIQRGAPSHDGLSPSMIKNSRISNLENDTCLSESADCFLSFFKLLRCSCSCNSSIDTLADLELRRRKLCRRGSGISLSKIGFIRKRDKRNCYSRPFPLSRLVVLRLSLQQYFNAPHYSRCCCCRWQYCSLLLDGVGPSWLQLQQ